MSMQFSFGRVQIGDREAGEPGPPSDETLFRIVVLGDFSGRASRGPVDPARLRQLKPVAVDRDNFDGLMGRLGVELQLPAPDSGGRLAICFKELDDFKPDRIFEQMEVFDKLKQTRRKLSDPATFAAAAAEMSAWAKTSAPAKQAEPGSAPPVSENLLDQIFGETSARAASEASGDVDWNRFLRNVVSAYAVPKEDPRQPELVAQVDAATSGLMRAILHHPDFQALEAAWRGLQFLVRRLDTDEKLRLFFLDVSRAELAADLASSDDLSTTALYRLLVEQTVGTPGAQPWAVLVGNYTFGPTKADAELLGRLGKIARQAGAPFLAAASSAVVGCSSFALQPDRDDWKPLSGEAQEAWGAVRSLPEASYLGLVMPRFLLRLPYGKASDPVEAFNFEEVATPPSPPSQGGDKGGVHEAYLWGNPAVACAYLLGEGFNRRGWGMQLGTFTDIEGLPLHVYEGEDGSAAKPCAEAMLSHRAAERIVDAGIMPLLSMQGRDAVRLDRFRSLSIANPTLVGRWGS